MVRFQRPVTALLLVLGALALPASASPRVTAYWEQVTFHEALRKLQHECAGEITTSEGAEREDYREPVGARRATFDWREAPLERVLWDLGRAFGSVPRRVAAGGIRFEPGRLPEGGFVVTRDGLQLELAGIQQEVEVSREQGRTTEPRRSLVLSLTVRAPEGAPERFYGLERIRARDDRGREIRLPQLEPLRPRANEETGIAGEAQLRVELPGAQSGAGALETLDGDALVYREVRVHRIEIPLAGSQRDRQVGEVRLTGISARPQGDGVRASSFFSWPKSVEVGERGSRQGPFPVAARLVDGQLVPLECRVPELLVDENGTRSGKAEIRGDHLGGTPVALVLDVLEKELPLERVAFRLSGIPLPLADTPGRQAGEPKKGPGELLVVVRSVREARGALSVGLSRREPSGWSPFRWSALETDGQGEARLSGIAPGSYRVRVSFRARTSGGPTTSVPLHVPAGGMVRVLPGEETRLVCTP